MTNTENTPIHYNRIDERIADRDALLRLLIANDRHALAALDRGDDLAVIRRIVKASLTDALGIAVERAGSRGHATRYVNRAVAGLR